MISSIYSQSEIPVTFLVMIVHAVKDQLNVHLPSDSAG